MQHYLKIAEMAEVAEREMNKGSDEVLRHLLHMVQLHCLEMAAPEGEPFRYTQWRRPPPEGKGKD